MGDFKFNKKSYGNFSNFRNKAMGTSNLWNKTMGTPSKKCGGDIKFKKKDTITPILEIKLWGHQIYEIKLWGHLWKNEVGTSNSRKKVTVNQILEIKLWGH